MIIPNPLLHQTATIHKPPEFPVRPTFPIRSYHSKFDWTLDKRPLVEVRDPHPTDYHLTPQEKLFILMTMSLCIAAPSALVFFVLYVKDIVKRRQVKMMKKKMKSHLNTPRLYHKSAQTQNNISNNLC